MDTRRDPNVLQEMKSPPTRATPKIAGLAVDRDLVRRIVLSAPFAKSPRLSHFLRYICTETEASRQLEINEQSIGIAVFGRSPDFDSAGDSIVRSHASRLRHRLQEYFEQEGAQEPIILTIPKGSYVPRFALRVPGQKTDDTDAAAQHTDPERFPMPRVQPAARQHHTSASTEPGTAQRTIRRLKFALALAVLTAVAASLALFLHLRGPSHVRHHIFWSRFLDPGQGRTMLVESDSGLVMLQHFTNRPVSLASYMSGAYLTDVSPASVSPDMVTRLGGRRYTPAVDSFIYEKISHLIPDVGDNITFRYARDLRLDELKQGNAILLGTHESDPWVALFEPSMNFTFRTDLAKSVTVMQNRHPQPDEQAEYPMLSTDPEHTVYGLVAYRPNLTHTGQVLIVEGETMAGTQSASEFLLDDAHLLPFLTSIKRNDGSIPHFEVLIRSSSLGGESSRIEPVAYRVEND
jgi:hypothetical protein